MQFHKFLLDDYMHTKDGGRVKRFFADFERQFENRDNGSSFYRFVDSLLSLPVAQNAFSQEREEDFVFAEGEVDSFNEFAELWTVQFEDEVAAHDLQMSMPYYSVCASVTNPQYAFPYLFPNEFFRFRFICEAFGIPLPVIPPRKHYSERCNYYIQLCQALHDFRLEHGLTPVELWTFLYGFAPRFVGSFIASGYGEPNRAYIVGATQYDVEEQLLEPLLRKLGYTKWVRQLPLRMGRGDRVFPDYALNVTGRGDDAAAEFVWEAKYRIPTTKQLKIDFGQAKSYALRLQSKALGLIAIEGVWFVTEKEEFRFDRLKHFTWEQLASPDALAELKRAFRRA